MNTGLHLTKTILQIYSTTKETYLRRKERPFTYMPQFIRTKSQKGLLTPNFQLPFSKYFLRKKPKSCSKYNQFVFADLAYSYPDLILYTTFIASTAILPGSPLLEVPRFEQFSTLPLTWIGAFVRNPILWDRLEQCLYLRIISVLLAGTLPFVQVFYILLYRTSKVKTYPSLLRYSLMAIIPQPYGIRVYH